MAATITTTSYGFKWGAAKVERTLCNEGTVVLGVGSVYDREHDYALRIHVSPKGRSIRVWKNGKELK